jgi:hypothetical protein
MDAGPSGLGCSIGVIYLHSPRCIGATRSQERNVFFLSLSSLQMRSANRFLYFLLLLLPLSAHSQSYKKLRVGAGIGVTGFRPGPSMALYTEPSYRLNDRFAFGLRVETNFRQGSMPVLGSFTLTGQYYFSATKRTRFFAGLGAGAFSSNSNHLDHALATKIRQKEFSVSTHALALTMVTSRCSLSTMSCNA